MKDVTTSSFSCQEWIQRGLLDTFGFRREEAIRCFQKAISLDGECAMAHYFLAYNNAADYNFHEGLDYALGYQEAQRALQLSQKQGSSLSHWEGALIRALTERFCWPVGSVPLKDLHRNYAEAMRPVYQELGEEDADIAAFFAESLMMLSPWELWTAPPDIKAAIPETEELVGVLEKALERFPTHPALCHFYIHTMELSATPSKALSVADTLRDLCPNQGHLLHMPSHIDVWVGQYQEAIEANRKAVLADEAYRQEADPPGSREHEMYTSYRIHNYHFAAWVAMFDGQFSVAMEFAEEAERQMNIETVTCKIRVDFPMGATFLEGFASIPWHVLVRFGKWEEIINRPQKKEAGGEREAFVGTVAVSHYARGVAFAALARTEEAEAERGKFYALLHGSASKKALQSRYIHNNPMLRKDLDESDDADGDASHPGVLDVAEAVLNGEIEFRKGNFVEAFRHLRLAVRRDQAMLYDEPWGWMMPASHVLGALLLERGGPGEAPEAEAVYRRDLKRYPKNLWSLLGLSQALQLQGKEEEARAVRGLFRAASARADVEIGASCLCSRKTCCQAQD